MRRADRPRPRQVSDDATIGTCWVDRLTLTRFGIALDAALLSTEQGRALAADPTSVPDQDACDWAWVALRYPLTTSTSTLAA